MIVSDAPNCGVTYDRHYDNHNSFIIQARGNCDVCAGQKILFINKTKQDEILLTPKVKEQENFCQIP
jgi:hypothetical protein